MICLGFLMIHVGYEFEIDKRNVRQYAVDYGIAATAAGFPWLFCSAYFVWVMGSDSWAEALLAGRFAAPTSAGILFSMLAAAGLSATWVFRKARVLAIFDHLDTNLGKMFPLFCYRTEASWKERLALCIGLWPRGEVGAGVLVVSLSYGIAAPIVAAAALSLALNLVLTGLFILAVKALVAR